MFVKSISVHRLGEDTTEVRSENPSSTDQVNLSRSGNCKSEDKQVKSNLLSEQKSETSAYSPALKNFKNCILNDKALAEYNLFSSSTHIASSEGGVSRYEYVNLVPPYGSSVPSNALQLVRCAFPSQCLPNNFIGSIAPMAYFENGPSHPILLTSCYPEAQPGFSYSNGNVIIPHGACQGIQYIVPYPVNGFNGGLQPILPVILPNNHTLPVMECFNNLAFYSPIQCLTKEHEATPNNIQSFDSTATIQSHFLLSPSDECPTTVGNDDCPNIEESNMQEVWHQTFDDLFKTFPDHWILIPTPQSDPDKACRVILRDNAKVRFMCRECRNAWTSMKGCIVFWVNLDQVRQSGEVYFRLFGQQCQKCETKEFQFSMWYPEEVKKVLKNLHVRVGNVFYGLPKVEFNTCRRQGKPRSPHNSSLCQACFNKVCTENVQ